MDGQRTLQLRRGKGNGGWRYHVDEAAIQHQILRADVVHEERLAQLSVRCRLGQWKRHLERLMTHACVSSHAISQACRHREVEYQPCSCEQS
jgi:hypothetical protein